MIEYQSKINGSGKNVVGLECKNIWQKVGDTKSVKQMIAAKIQCSFGNGVEMIFILIIWIGQVENK